MSAVRARGFLSKVLALLVLAVPLSAIASGVTSSGLGLAVPANGVFAILVADLNAIIGNGQSLSQAAVSVAPASTVEYGQNVSILDDSGLYALDGASQSHVYFGNLVSPPRVGFNLGAGNGQIFPNTANPGEYVNVSMGNSLYALTGLRIESETVGVGGTNIAARSEGGTFNAWQAGIWEVQQATRLSAAMGKSYRVIFTLNVDGETDCVDVRPTYEQALYGLQQSWQSQFQAITGQDSGIPMLYYQTGSCPNFVDGGTGPGGSSSPALSPLDQYQATLDHPRDLFLIGPEYMWPSYGDGIHKVDPGYAGMGDKAGEVAAVIARTGTWLPLMPISVTRVGNAMVLTYNVPVGPMLFDDAQPQVHLAGTPWGDNGANFPGVKGWTGGQGYELYKNNAPIGIASVAISGNTVTVTGVSQPDAVAYAYTPDSGVHPDGGGTSCWGCKSGNLRDSDPFVGPTRTSWLLDASAPGYGTNPNAGVSFFLGGFSVAGGLHAAANDDGIAGLLALGVVATIARRKRAA